MTENQDPTIEVIVTRSSGSDGAVLVFIDTAGFEPDGSDGPGLRVWINDYCVPAHGMVAHIPPPADTQTRTAATRSLAVSLAELAYREAQ